MVLYSASRRTDMVAFHPDAIVDAVARSRRLEGIVFWTKDPRHLVTHPRLSVLPPSIPTVVQLTVTGLAGSVWEPHVPPLEVWEGELRALSERLPPGAIQWRFDPILADATVRERFLRTLERLDRLIGPLDTVTVSFPDAYKRVRARLGRHGLAFPDCGHEERIGILSQMHEASGLPMALCCEPSLLSLPFVRKAACIDAVRFDTLYGTHAAPLGKDKGQRMACGCVVSRDIGSYAMACGHGCRYCYACPAEAEGG